MIERAVSACGNSILDSWTRRSIRISLNGRGLIAGEYRNTGVLNGLRQADRPLGTGAGPSQQPGVPDAACRDSCLKGMTHRVKGSAKAAPWLPHVSPLGAEILLARLTAS